MGYVQSGKTANFSALIAKAADVGYKIVIVLSGLHNSLRQQTQKRLQRDLGHEHTPGVGLPEPGRQWVWMTSAESWGDFNPYAVNAALLQGNDQVAFVVKKNASRLRRLVQWMRGRVPEHVPVLIVDDEADQASINTRGNRRPRELVDLATDDIDADDVTEEELDPSAINGLVRELLSLFARGAYVAYTATPFANVLIDPDAVDDLAGQDLYPRDFIVALPRPPGRLYVGTDRLFGRDDLLGDGDDGGLDGLPLTERVPDSDIPLLVPPRGDRDFIPTLPVSLRHALHDFVLAAAAHLHRSQRDMPCTMLVHADQRRAVQNPLAGDIEVELAHLRQQWRYDRDSISPTLRDRWDSNFRPITASIDLSREVEFEAIEPEIDHLMRDGIPVRLLNSDSDHVLDFDVEPNLRAVIVGGNKLSRGLTIEGLLVSYYVRETAYYDTLLQMSRWFGYRGEYVDLTRLWSTQTLLSWFRDLATAEEDLRREIARYEREGLTPLEFGPRIRTHPAMLVTAPNKMREASVIAQSYAGRLLQVLRYPIEPVDEAWLRRNLDAVRTLLSALGPPGSTGLQPTWADVDVRLIDEFLAAYAAPFQTAIDIPTARRYISEQVQQGELISWRVSVRENRRRSTALGTDDLAIEGYPEVNLINRSRLRDDRTSLGVITSPDDEGVGLTAEQIEEARDRARIGEYPTRGYALRAQRDASEGLLLIYPIGPRSTPDTRANNRVDLFDVPDGKPAVIGFALSFPTSNSAATVEYVVRPDPLADE